MFTGAGVSAESGIPTFRDDEGFWQQFPVREFATWKGLVRTAIRRPRRLADFIHAVLHPIAVAKPNAGHRAIAEMEKHVGVTVVTQNIDNLHQEAGNTIVHEVHGSLFEVVTRRGRFIRLLSRRQLLQIAEALEPGAARLARPTARALGDSSSGRTRAARAVPAPDHTVWRCHGGTGLVPRPGGCSAMRLHDPGGHVGHRNAGRDTSFRGEGGGGEDRHDRPERRRRRCLASGNCGDGAAAVTYGRFQHREVINGGKAVILK